MADDETLRQQHAARAMELKPEYFSHLSVPILGRDLEEIHPGVSRREVLLIGLGALVDVLGRSRPAGSSSAKPFARFVEQGGQQADRFTAAASGGVSAESQMAYLDRLERLLAPVTAFPHETYSDHPWGTRGSIRAAKTERWPLRLYFVRMQAGAEMPPHDHIGHLGLLRILSGKVRVRTLHELQGSRTPSGLELEEVGDGVLGPGATTRVYGELGVHQLAARTDVSFLDVMTVTVQRGEPVGSRRLSCSTVGRRCTATWVDS